MPSRDLDLQRIRKDYKITQQNIAGLVDYPQSFISQIENRRVSAPERFQKKLMKVLGIKDLEPYFFPSSEDQAAGAVSKLVSEKVDEQLSTVNRLLGMLEQRDERIRELESMNMRLQEMLFEMNKK